MQNAARLRQQIESSLNRRIPAALSPRLCTELIHVPCGIPAIDAQLDGGLPLAVVTELVGAECSGRTSTALAYVAALTQSGSVCAWIDAADTLDPESVAANGVDPERLLWVRCGPPQSRSFQAISAGEIPAVAAASYSAPRSTGGGSPHPRTEGRNMPAAVAAMLSAHGGMQNKFVKRENKSIGTPGAANRTLSYRSAEREEQVNSDRQPARRGDNLAPLVLAPRCAKPQPRQSPATLSGGRLPVESITIRTATSPASWQAFDQALRATDLLLQAGGFSVIVLDLGSTPPEIAWRIPLATWFRFRAACQRTRAGLLLLTQHPCARSAAELVVRLEAATIEAEDTVITGIRHRAATERSRAQQSGERVVPIRKPPQSVRAADELPGQWNSEAPWAQTS